jgi:glutathione S-transferase
MKPFGSAASACGDQLRNVDVALRDGRTYLIGEQLTTVDILFTTCLTCAVDYGAGIRESAEPYLVRTTAREALGGEKTNLPKGLDAMLW